MQCSNSLRLVLGGLSKRRIRSSRGHGLNDREDYECTIEGVLNFDELKNLTQTFENILMWRRKETELFRNNSFIKWNRLHAWLRLLQQYWISARFAFEYSYYAHTRAILIVNSLDSLVACYRHNINSYNI